MNETEKEGWLVEGGESNRQLLKETVNLRQLYRLELTSSKILISYCHLSKFTTDMYYTVIHSGKTISSQELDIRWINKHVVAFHIGQNHCLGCAHSTKAISAWLITLVIK